VTTSKGKDLRDNLPVVERRILAPSTADCRQPAQMFTPIQGIFLLPCHISDGMVREGRGDHDRPEARFDRDARNQFRRLMASGDGRHQDRQRRSRPLRNVVQHGRALIDLLR
jgi:hypothetical protein